MSLRYLNSHCTRYTIVHLLPNSLECAIIAILHSIGGVKLLTISAFAKINLTLDILGKRDDGFHEVALVLQSIALSDTLELAKIPSGIKLEIVSDDIAADVLPSDHNNLAYRAAQLVLERFKIDSGLFIRLNKRIPIAAGLAGGSTDAAAVIRGMNQLFNLRLNLQQMCNIAAEIGSDVPFCIVGGTCLATGRGEKLTRLADLPTLPIVLLKPRGAIPTAWAYQTYDSLTHEGPVRKGNSRGSSRDLSTQEICEAINISDTKAVCEMIFNVLEQVAVIKYPAIESYKQRLLELGAVAAMMSGSGPSIFGIAKSRTEAERIAEDFKGSGLQVFVTETVGSYSVG